MELSDAHRATLRRYGLDQTPEGDLVPLLCVTIKTLEDILAQGGLTEAALTSGAELHDLIGHTLDKWRAGYGAAAVLQELADAFDEIPDPPQV